MDLAREQALRQLEDEYFYFLWKIKEGTARLFKPTGIKPDQLLLMEMVSRGLAHPKDIAEALQWDPPLLSHYLSKLESKGLIERSLDPTDRRRTNVRITEAGRALLDQVRETWHAHTARALADLSTNELLWLHDVLQRILKTKPRQQETNPTTGAHAKP